MKAWAFLSGFGASAMLLPGAALLTAWLLYSGLRRQALRWLLLFSTGAAAVAVSKAAFLGWGVGLRRIDFTGFSGHAMLAAAVYPSLFSALLARTSRGMRAAGLGTGLTLAAAVSMSRVALSAHSLSESVTGFGLGAIIALLFVRELNRPPRRPQPTNERRSESDDGSQSKNHRATAPRLPESADSAADGRSGVAPAAAALVLALILTALHGHRLPTQHWITEAALRLSGHDAPFVRAIWLIHGRDRRSRQHGFHRPLRI